MGDEATLGVGDQGPAVEALRDVLKRNGYFSKKAPDGKSYDAWTVQAVRQFQMKHRLIPTGTVTPELRQAIEKNVALTPGERRALLGDAVLDQMTMHMRHLAYPQEALLYVPQTASQMEVSSQGMLFIAVHEASVSHLYIPGPGSGITAGIGYDMKLRDADEVRKDLQSAKVWGELTPSAQKLFLAAADLAGPYATWKKFVEDVEVEDVLTADQSWRLFQHTLNEKYVSHLKQQLAGGGEVKLLQPQFDALVSYTFNAWNLPSGALKALKKQPPDFAAAVRAMSAVVTSKDEVTSALVKRREAEVRLFLYGHYGQLVRPRHRQLRPVGPKKGPRPFDAPPPKTNTRLT